MYKHHSLQRSSLGFTIVELIIVIIVIGILATLALIGYSNVINNSKSNTARTAANVLSKKLENYYSAIGAYPTDTTASAFTAKLNSRPDSSIDNAPVKIVPRDTIDSSNGQDSVAVSICTSPQTVADATAYKIEYWDYGTNTWSSKTITGNASTTDCDNWAPLT